MLMACISQVEMRLPDQRNVFSELVALSPDVILNQIRRVDFGKLPYQHLMGEDSNKIEEEYRQMIHINWREELPDGVIPTDTKSFWLQVWQMRRCDPGDATFAALSNYALSCLSVAIKAVFHYATFFARSDILLWNLNRFLIRSRRELVRQKKNVDLVDKCRVVENRL